MPKTYRLIEDGENPFVQSVSLALAILSHTGTTSWKELGELIAARDEKVLGKVKTLALTERQTALVDHAAARGYLSAIGLKPTISIAVCDTCGEWFVVQNAVPKRCMMNYRCEGIPVKASKAERKEND